MIIFSLIREKGSSFKQKGEEEDVTRVQIFKIHLWAKIKMMKHFSKKGTYLPNCVCCICYVPHVVHGCVVGSRTIQVGRDIPIHMANDILLLLLGWVEG